MYFWGTLFFLFSFICMLKCNLYSSHIPFLLSHVYPITWSVMLTRLSYHVVYHVVCCVIPTNTSYSVPLHTSYSVRLHQRHRLHLTPTLPWLNSTTYTILLSYPNTKSKMAPFFYFCRGLLPIFHIWGPLHPTFLRFWARGHCPFLRQSLSYTSINSITFLA